MAKRTVPLPRSVGHESATVFDAGSAVSVCATVPFPVRLTGGLLAESLNDSIIDFLASYAISNAGTPSAKRDWSRSMRSAADSCLEMLAPGFSKLHPPSGALLEVYPVLIHDDPPANIHPAQLKWLGYRDEWELLDKTAKALWLLRMYADNASDRWGAEPTSIEKRRTARSYFLTWLSGLGRCYVEAFQRMPSAASAEGPFCRFAEGIRHKALAVRQEVTNNGTDPQAYRELSQFGPGAMVSFAKRHASILRPRWEQALRLLQQGGANQVKDLC